MITTLEIPIRTTNPREEWEELSKAISAGIRWYAASENERTLDDPNHLARMAELLNSLIEMRKTLD